MGMNYKYLGDEERVFPTVLGPDGTTLVCKPGDTVALSGKVDHPLLQPVKASKPATKAAKKAAAQTPAPVEPDAPQEDAK